MLIGLIVIALVTIILVCIKLSNIVLKPKVSSIENELNKNENIKSIYEEFPKINKNIKMKYSNLKEEDIIIESTIILREGLDEKDLKYSQNKEKIVVLAHGFTSNRIGVVKYIDTFREKGYNICIYDHRNSGNTNGKYTTMGYIEKYDLQRVIKECRKMFGEKSQIGVFGESMGASTALLLTEIEENINFIVADCGYSILSEELAYQLKQKYKLPKFPFINISSVITKIKGGFLYSQVKPIDTISKCGLNIPILFIHGECDKFTPTYMSENMYEKRLQSVNKNVLTKLYIAPNSGHALSYYKNKKEYKEQVHKFLEEIDGSY